MKHTQHLNQESPPGKHHCFRFTDEVTVPREKSGARSHGCTEAPARGPSRLSPTLDATPPAQKPSESPSASAVQSIWNEVADLDRPDMMDMDAALLSDLYGIESSDLVEFIGKMPLMSAHVNEFLIAQCAPGRVDAVKAACEARLETLKAGNMYPETLTLLENYKLVTSGDYILFCIDEHADAMVEAFNTYAK